MCLAIAAGLAIHASTCAGAADELEATVVRVTANGDLAEPEDGGLRAISAASVKTQGTAGTFGLDLPLNHSGIECRIGQRPAQQTVAIKFSEPVFGAEGVEVFCGVQESGYFAGDTLNVTFIGDCNKKHITIYSTGITGTEGYISLFYFSYSIILGDVTADRQVNDADVQAIKAHVSATPVDESTARYDVDCDGFVTEADANRVRQLIAAAQP